MRHNIVSLKLKYNHADVFTILHSRNIRQEIGNYYPYPEPRYYRVPRYFFTVLTVEQNQWYRATLRCKMLNAPASLSTYVLCYLFMG